MSKSIISIFIIVVFTTFITTPAIIILVDESVDVSYFYSLSEEEEKKCEVDVFQNNDSNQLVDFVQDKKDNADRYFYKRYSKPHLNIISPPPDFI